MERKTGPRPEFKDYELLAEMRKSSREVYRVQRAVLGGEAFLHIRVWYTCSDGVLRPSSRGIEVRRDKLDRFIAMLQAVRLKTGEDVL